MKPIKMDLDKIKKAIQAGHSYIKVGNTRRQGDRFLVPSPHVYQLPPRTTRRRQFHYCSFK